MTLTSTDIQAGDRMPKAQEFSGFGCSGDNRSPALSWRDVPAGTKSLALTVYDPDAPTGSGWWHWQVYDLPAGLTALPAGAGQPDSELLPEGSRQGPNDYGQQAFGGACPPKGELHRYQFTLHALDVERLQVPEQPSAALIGYMINAHSLASARLEALYSR
nr:YbhB/YbcL family Raf kinase inhibitor-like protein [Marinobacterium arenosum]